MNTLKYGVAFVALFFLFTACSKEYSLETGIDPRAGWQFRDEDKFIKGPFYDVYDTTRPGVGYLLVLVGTTSIVSDTVLVAQVHFPGGRIKTGTYNTNSFGNGFYCLDATDSTNLVYLYTAEPRSDGVNLSFVVDEYDPVTQMISISFSGTALNPLKKPVNLEMGRFYAKVR